MGIHRSQLYPNPEGDDKPPTFAANSGDVICVSNFNGALLDLPINSPKKYGELVFEANTERIPPFDTKVTIILSPYQKTRKSSRALSSAACGLAVCRLRLSTLCQAGRWMRQGLVAPTTAEPEGPRLSCKRP